MAYTLGANTGAMYRRANTTRAPRKRSFLINVQARPPRSEVAPVVGGGNGGPMGPADIRLCCWDNNDEGRNSGRSLMALGVITAAVGWCAAAAASDFETEFGGISSVESMADGSCFGISTEGFDEASHAFTEEEKELVIPKQYRVREWVYVH